MKEEQIVLDFSGCKYITEVHWKIRDTFHFPSFYGENLDALWDMGCDYIGSSDMNILTKVIIKGINNLPKDIRELDIPEIMDVFYDIQKTWKNIEFIIENEGR